MCVCVAEKTIDDRERDNSSGACTSRGGGGLLRTLGDYIVTPIFRVWSELDRLVEAEMEHFWSNHDALYFCVFFGPSRG